LKVIGFEIYLKGLRDTPSFSNIIDFLWKIYY